MKVGGDKGGSSFKMMIQLANVSKPNSVQNTTIVVMFDAVDNIFNLQLALQGFSAEIEHLTTTTWRYSCLCLIFTYLIYLKIMIDSILQAEAF